MRLNVAQTQKHWGCGCLTPEKDQSVKSLGREFVGSTTNLAPHAFAQQTFDAVSGNGKRRNPLGYAYAVLDLSRRCKSVGRRCGC